MSEYDKTYYWKLKADPERYAAYLQKKAQEQKARRPLSTQRSTQAKQRWRAAHPDKALAIRKANHAVELAIKAGKITRASECSRCGSGSNIEAHHFMGYAPEHHLDIEWLCRTCHHATHKTEKAIPSYPNNRA